MTPRHLRLVQPDASDPQPGPLPDDPDNLAMGWAIVAPAALLAAVVVIGAVVGWIVGGVW